MSRPVEEASVKGFRRSFLYILYDLFKIKQTILLAYVGIFGYLIAAGYSIDLYKLVLIITGLFTTISGTTGFNMIYDADIDAIMMRTRDRVIPRGDISRREAFAISFPTLLIGLIVSYIVSPLFFVAALMGFIIDIIAYTLITKRRTWISVVIGGFAGGMPAFGGYVAHTDKIDLYAISLMLIVAMWSSPHIWYISAYYKEDYIKARIPTLSVVKGVGAMAKVSALMIGIIFGVIIIDHVASGFKMWLSLTTSAVMTIILIKRMLTHNDYTSRSEIRKIFKFLSPYLALIFLTIYLDKIFFI